MNPVVAMKLRNLRPVAERLRAAWRNAVDRRALYVDFEAEIDVARGLTAAHAPILRRRLAQQDEDVIDSGILNASRTAACTASISCSS